MMALGRRLEREQVGFVGSILPALSGGLSRNHQLRAGIAGKSLNFGIGAEGPNVRKSTLRNPIFRRFANDR